MQLGDNHLELELYQLLEDGKQLYLKDLRFHDHVALIRKMVPRDLNSIESARLILRVRYLLYLQLTELVSLPFLILELEHHLHLVRQFMRQQQNIKHQIAPLLIPHQHLLERICHQVWTPNHRCP